MNIIQRFFGKKQPLGGASRASVQEPVNTLTLWKSGHWWSAPPVPGQPPRCLTVIGCRQGDEPDGAQVNEAMTQGMIARSARIFVCDGFPRDCSDKEIETITIEISKLVAGDCGVVWSQTRWAVLTMVSRTYGNRAVVVSSGV